MKAKKVFRVIGIIVLLLVLVIVVSFNLYGTKAIKIGVEKGATSALKVPVVLESVNLSIMSGKAGMKGLEVDNPEGYENKKLLQLANAQVKMQISSLLSDTLLIDEILLEDIKVSMEQKGLTNNIKDILNNLPKSEETSPEPETASEGSQKKLKIKTLQINGVTVKVKLIPLPGKIDTVSLKLAPITLNDLGSDQPLDIPGLTGKILVAITEGIMEQGAGVLPEQMLDSLGDVTKVLMEGASDVLEGGKEALKSGGNILEGGKEAADKTLKEVQGIGENIGKDLGGLFKKKDKDSE
ncbi:MAG: hypothetical protein K9M57_04680 [Phycisphaerae bacterium]|nr:hypothetical protein [Phycisphaerae bacterium]